MRLLSGQACRFITNMLPMDCLRLRTCNLRCSGCARGEAIMRRRAVASLVISFIFTTSMLLAAGAPD